MRFISFQFKQINLQQKFILVVVLFILLPVGTAGVFFYISSEGYVIERTENEGRQTLSLLQKNVDLLLQNYEEQLMTLYQNEELIHSLSTIEENDVEAEGAINRVLRGFLRGKEGIESIYLFPNDVEQVFFYDQKGSALFMEQIDFHPEWIQRLNQSNGETIWLNTYKLPPNRYNSQNSYYFIGAMQIKDIFGLLEPLGSIMINIKVDALDHLMSDIQVSPHGFLLLTNSAGSVIWHRNADALGRSIHDLPFFTSLEERSTEYFTQKLNGVKYEIVVMPSIYNQWHYYSFVPHSDLNAETENIKRFINLTLIVSVIIFSFLAIMTAMYITRPLRRIVVAMNHFGKNNQAIMLDTDSKDEIGLLHRSFNRMSSKIHTLIEEVRVVSAKEKEAELKALQAQINPHFVYNTLDTINWMAIEKQESEISQMITSLSDIMRYAIRPDDQLVTVEEEIKWAKNYVHIQKNRFEDRFDLEFHIDERSLSYKIPRLLLQPFIENAIVHGMEEREDGGLIIVRIELNDTLDKICFYIEDNGIGMDKSKVQQIHERRISGVGIQNTMDRIKLKYGAEYGVTLYSNINEGTKVTITLPTMINQSGLNKGGDTHV